MGNNLNHASQPEQYDYFSRQSESPVESSSAFQAINAPRAQMTTEGTASGVLEAPDGDSQRFSWSPSDKERIAMEEHKRDRADADFQVPTPRKRSAKDQAETPGSSSKRLKKGKARGLEAPADAGSSRVTGSPQHDQELASKLTLVQSITDIWNLDPQNWPTYDFAPVRPPSDDETNDRNKKRQNRVERLEPIHWSFRLLQKVQELSMIKPDEQLCVVRRALEQAIAERNNGVAATAEGNSMTAQDLDSAIKKMGNDIWLATEFRDTRSPTYAPMARGHSLAATDELAQDMLQTLDEHIPLPPELETEACIAEPRASLEEEEDEFEKSLEVAIQRHRQERIQLQHDELQLQRRRAAFEQKWADFSELVERSRIHQAAFGGTMGS